MAFYLYLEENLYDPSVSKLFCTRMPADSPSQKKSASSNVRQEIEDLKNTLEILKEDVKVLEDREVGEEANQILEVLSQIQTAQTKMEASIDLFCEEATADKRKSDSCIMLLEEELKALHAEAKASCYIARVQRGIQRFFVIIAGELGLSAGSLADHLVLEEVKGQKSTQASVQKLLESKGLSLRVWKECCYVADTLVKSNALDQGLKTEDVIHMLNDEACPLQIERHRKSLLAALEYVKSQGY